MFNKCDMSCKEKTELLLKIVFVAVFTYGVINAVCCMKSCNGQSSCSKSKSCSVQAVKSCAANCQKACCAK